MANSFYSKTIWFKKNESFDFSELAKILSLHFSEPRYKGKIKVESFPAKILVKVGTWTYYLELNKTNYVESENQKIVQFSTSLKPYQTEIDYSFRIEVYGDDDSTMNYFNESLCVLEFIMKEYDCIIYDQQLCEIYEPTTSLIRPIH